MNEEMTIFWLWKYDDYRVQLQCMIHGNLSTTEPPLKQRYLKLWENDSEEHAVTAYVEGQIHVSHC